MTITLVGTSSAATGGANLTVALPGGTAADDVALLFITQRLSGGVCGTPTGWSIVPGFTFPPSMNDGCQAFYKRLVGGDANPTSVFTNISGQGVTGVMAVYRGCHTTLGPFAYNALGTFYGTTVGPKNVPAVSTEIANLMLVNMIGVLYVSSAPTVTNANGFTNRVALGVGTSWPCHATLLDKYVTNGYESQDSATLTTSFNAWNIMVGLIDATQPNRFASHQGSTSSVILRTDFPKPRLGGQQFNGGSNLTLTIPTGTLPGDVMIAAIVGDGFAVNAAAGWTSKGRVSEPNTGRPLDVFTRKYQAGDANPTFTLGHPSARNFGTIISFENGDTYDHDVTAQRTGADHAGPLLTGLDDAYNYAIQFNLRYYDGENANLTQMKVGSEFGFERLAGYTSTGAGWGIGLTIYGRQQLGAANVQGPTTREATWSGAGAIRLVQIQAFHQPVYIDAAIQQGSTGSVAMHQDVGYPIEVHMQEANHVSVKMRVSYPKRKPQRELVWVHNYSDERIGVVD